MNNNVMYETEVNIKSEYKLKKESKDFYNYINKLNLKDLNDVMILPETKHFFYTEIELRDFNVIVNVKKLNNILKIDNFMHNLYHMIKKDAYFFGCFENNKYIYFPRTKRSSHTFIRLIKALLLLVESKTERLLSEIDVHSLLEAHNFKVINMKEINGITYFYAKKI